MSQERTVSSRLTSLKDYALEHPAAVLAMVGCVGYFAAHGYFTGRAREIGVPFNFTPSTNGYVEVFLASAVFIVGSLIGVIVSGAVIRVSESKPRLGRALGGGYVILIAGLVLATLIAASFRQWLFGLYEPLLLFSVYILIMLGAGWMFFRISGSPLLSILFAVLALVGLYLTMTWIGSNAEQNRTNWQIASTNNEQFIVAGSRGDLLLVAPLVSTSPPTYLKQFRYLDIKTPDLRMQKVKFEKMLGEEAPRISLP